METDQLQSATQSEEELDVPSEEWVELDSYVSFIGRVNMTLHYVF